MSLFRVLFFSALTTRHRRSHGTLVWSGFTLGEKHGKENSFFSLPHWLVVWCVGVSDGFSSFFFLQKGIC